jgi:hypothetical protein
MFNYLEIETVNALGKRWYLTPIGALPSITTVLSGSESIEKTLKLEAWKTSLGRETADKVTKEAASRGTVVHVLVERFLKNENINSPIDGMPISNVDMMLFNALKIKLKNIKVWGQEKAVYSPSLEVAGRLDCAGEYKGVPSIIDIKTSTRIKNDKDIEDYKLQLIMYSVSHNELYNTDIKQGVILMSSAGGMPQEFIIKFTPDLLSQLKARINIFWDKVLKEF